jgi:hypothetical protein
MSVRGLCGPHLKRAGQGCSTEYAERRTNVAAARIVKKRSAKGSERWSVGLRYWTIAMSHHALHMVVGLALASQLRSQLLHH